ncbi:MAG: hypothetical protein RRB13_15980 [bacterium]|nr:hypothetical protein [bacterium]
MDRDKKEIYTVTIVRNFGIPLSFTIEKRKVGILTVLAAVIAGLLLYASIDYLVVRAQNRKMRHQLIQSDEKMSQLSQQVRELDQKYYAAGQEGAGRRLLKDSLAKQEELSTADIWDQRSSGLSFEEIQEGSAVEVAQLKAEVIGDQLELSVSMSNRSNPDQPVGGYLCITLANEDQAPTLYVSATGGPLGEKGFPSSYKQGRQYFLKAKGNKKTITQNLALKEANEYYTHAMVFIYSYKGTLLNRSAHPLDKAIFLE